MQLARAITRRLYRGTFRFGGCARVRSRRIRLRDDSTGMQFPAPSGVSKFRCYPSLRHFLGGASIPRPRAPLAVSAIPPPKFRAGIEYAGGMCVFFSPPPPPLFSIRWIISAGRASGDRRAAGRNNLHAFRATSRSRGVTGTFVSRRGGACIYFCWNERVAGYAGRSPAGVPGRDRARARAPAMRYEPEVVA